MGDPWLRILGSGLTASLSQSSESCSCCNLCPEAFLLTYYHQWRLKFTEIEDILPSVNSPLDCVTRRGLSHRGLIQGWKSSHEGGETQTSTFLLGSSWRYGRLQNTKPAGDDVSKEQSSCLLIRKSTKAALGLKASFSLVTCPRQWVAFQSDPSTAWKRASLAIRGLTLVLWCI